MYEAYHHSEIGASQFKLKTWKRKSNEYTIGIKKNWWVANTVASMIDVKIEIGVKLRRKWDDETNI